MQLYFEGNIWMILFVLYTESLGAVFPGSSSPCCIHALIFASWRKVLRSNSGADWKEQDYLGQCSVQESFNAFTAGKTQKKLCRIWGRREMQYNSMNNLATTFFYPIKTLLLLLFDTVLFSHLFICFNAKDFSCSHLSGSQTKPDPSIFTPSLQRKVK